MFNSVFKGVYFSVLIRLGNIFVAFLLSILVARSLGKDNFGLFIFLANVSLFVSVLSSFGLGRIALRIFSTKKYVESRVLRDKLFNGFFVLWLIISAIMFLLVFVLYVWFSNKLPFGINYQVTFLSILHGSIVGWRVIAVNIYIASKKNIDAALFDSFLSNLFLVIVLSVIFFIWGGRLDLEKVIFLYVLAVFFFQLIAWLRIKRIIAVPSTRISSVGGGAPVAKTEIVREASYAFYDNIGMSIAGLADVWVIGFYSSALFLADYGIAMKLATFVSFLLVSLNNIVPPYFRQYIDKNDVKGLERFCRFSSTIVAVPSIVFAVILYLWGGSLLALVFGQSYSSAAELLKIVLLMQVVNVITGSSGNILVMFGFNKELMRVSLCVSFLTLLVAVAFGYLGFSPKNIIWVFVIGSIFRQIGMWWLALRITGVNTAPMFKFGEIFFAYRQILISKHQLP